MFKPAWLLRSLDCIVAMSLLLMFATGMWLMLAQHAIGEYRFALAEGLLITLGAVALQLLFLYYIVSEQHPLESGESPFAQENKSYLTMASGLLTLLATARTIWALATLVDYHSHGYGVRVLAERLYSLSSSVAGVAIFMYPCCARQSFSVRLSMDVLFLLLWMAWIGLQTCLTVLRWSFDDGYY